jgi:hypothetical protein
MAAAKHLKVMRASKEGSCKMDALQTMHSQHNLILCRCVLHFMEHAPLALGRVLYLGSFILKSVPSIVMQKISKFFGFAALSSQTIFFDFKAAILLIHIQRGSPWQYLSQTPLNHKDSIDAFFG